MINIQSIQEQHQSRKIFFLKLNIIHKFELYQVPVLKEYFMSSTNKSKTHISPIYTITDEFNDDKTGVIRV